MDIKSKLDSLIRILETSVTPFPELTKIKSDYFEIQKSEVFSDLGPDQVDHYLNFFTSFGDISIFSENFEELVYTFSHDDSYRDHLVYAFGSLLAYINNGAKQSLISIWTNSEENTFNDFGMPIVDYIEDFL
ncbi:MAG: hypothetical protein ACRCXZ_01625 [Patescibacteria group bacterium]